MKKELFIAPNTKVSFDRIENLFSYLNNLRYALISDNNVLSLFGDFIKNQFEKRGIDLYITSFQAGEKFKTRKTKEELEDRLIKEGFGRDGCIIAFGGGVVSDLVGFLAATYFRGIPFINIPTTLLSMVDASIGGKVAVNTEFGKNLIGTYHSPNLVLIDEKFLKTLPNDELMNGFAEIIKYALIASKTLFEKLEQGKRENDELIYNSISIKKKIIEEDYFDRSFRNVLNFGHTIGHALEKLSNYTLSHGRAVAIGLLFESYLSIKVGGLAEKDFERIRALLTIFNFEKWKKDIKFEDLIKALYFDKKGERRFVLLKSIGETLQSESGFLHKINIELLKESYDFFCS